MKVTSKCGNIVDEKVDALISTGNVQLNMSGGVNGELLLRGGQDMQKQLHAYLQENNIHYVKPGFVMEIGPEPTHFQCVVYAVAIDGFYGSSLDLVRKTLCNAFMLAEERGCQSIAVPALATGYGPLSITEFATALQQCFQQNSWSFEEIRVVLRNEHDLEEFQTVFP